MAASRKMAKTSIIVIHGAATSSIGIFLPDIAGYMIPKKTAQMIRKAAQTTIMPECFISAELTSVTKSMQD